MRLRVKAVYGSGIKKTANSGRIAEGRKSL